MSRPAQMHESVSVPNARKATGKYTETLIEVGVSTPIRVVPAEMTGAQESPCCQPSTKHSCDENCRLLSTHRGPTYCCKMRAKRPRFPCSFGVDKQAVNCFACRSSSAHLQKWLAAHSNRRTERRPVSPQCFESESPALQGIRLLKRDFLKATHSASFSKERQVYAAELLYTLALLRGELQETETDSLGRSRYHIMCGGQEVFQLRSPLSHFT